MKLFSSSLVCVIYIPSLLPSFSLFLSPPLTLCIGARILRLTPCIPPKSESAKFVPDMFIVFYHSYGKSRSKLSRVPIRYSFQYYSYFIFHSFRSHSFRRFCFYERGRVKHIICVIIFEFYFVQMTKLCVGSAV